MQELNVDSRSFPQIWETLTQGDKEKATRQIIADGCTLSRQTIWNWSSGKWQPRTLALRKAVASAVKKSLGINVFAQTLFPAK